MRVLTMYCYLTEQTVLLRFLFVLDPRTQQRHPHIYTVGTVSF